MSALTLLFLFFSRALLYISARFVDLIIRFRSGAGNAALPPHMFSIRPLFISRLFCLFFVVVPCFAASVSGFQPTSFTFNVSAEKKSYCVFFFFFGGDS